MVLLRILAAGCLLGSLAADDGRADESRWQPQVGSPYPEFLLPRIDTGEAVSLADFRGRKVLLIHFASW